VSRYSQLTDDELLAEGAALEARLRNIEAQCEPLALQVHAEGRKLNKVVGKLGLTTGGAIAGMVAIPLTMGWSLLAAAVPAALAASEMREFATDYRHLRSLRDDLADLRDEAAEIADQIDFILQELDSRA
jgi:hypothetical protein